MAKRYKPRSKEAGYGQICIVCKKPIYRNGKPINVYGRVNPVWHHGSCKRKNYSKYIK